MLFRRTYRAGGGRRRAALRSLHAFIAFVLVALALVGGTAQAPAYSNTNVCFLVADGGNLLSRFDRSTGVETLVGGLGVSNVEADAFWPGTDVLYGADAATLGTINLTSGTYTSIGSFGSATSMRPRSPSTMSMA